MPDRLKVDLAVIGAGLAGSACLARLHQQGFEGTTAVVEAGRGPGGRMATRRRRENPAWRLDHGAPGLQLSEHLPDGVEQLLRPLREQGTLRREWGWITGLDATGQMVDAPEEHSDKGAWHRGQPTMAHLCEGLLDQASPSLERNFGFRVRWLQHTGGHWLLMDDTRQTAVEARILVMSGTLLAHPRSLAMLAWPDVPLRSAIPAHQDPDLDRVLQQLAGSRAAVRWNLMLELPGEDDRNAPLPRQILLTPEAQRRWQVERVVVHPQSDGGLGVVVHGLDSGEPIKPSSQPALLKREEQRLMELLPELLKAFPALMRQWPQARSLGVMRWGASQPLNHPLPTSLQWCMASNIGFCGDWIEGAGFGRAEGALRSGVALAELLQPGA